VEASFVHTDWPELLDSEGPDAAVVLDEQLRVVWRARSNAALTGEPELADAGGTSTLLEPVSLAPFVAALAECRRRPGLAVPVEFSFRAPRGELLAHGWLSDIGHLRAGHTLLRFCVIEPLSPNGGPPDEHGRLHGIAVHEVTDVLATRESMRQVLDLLPVMVFAVDTAGRLLFTNEATRDFLGAGTSAVEGMHLASMLGEVAGGDLLDAIEELIRSGQTVADIEDVVRVPDGGERHLRTWLVPYEDTGSGAPAVLAVSSDVTEQVANEALLTALGRNMPDLALVTQGLESRSFVSASVQRLLGWLPEDFRTLPVADTVHPLDLERTMAVRDPKLSAPGSNHTAELRLLHHDGSWRWFEMHAINLSNVPAIGGMLMFGRDIMARKARDEQLRFDATHDPLTSLLNRSAIIEQLELALGDTREHGAPVGALFIDLDNFKLVNDALGHETGDSLLQDVALALEGSLRGSDTVGRLGGDEFLVIVGDIEDEDTVLRVARRVSDSVADLTRDTSYPVTLSIGACVSYEGDTTAGAMVRDADAAMYRAKVGGKARTQLFHSAIGQHAERRLEVSRELAAALDDGRFTVHYQPIFSRHDDGLWRVRALEALARCPLDDGTMLQPDEFVPVAEQTGLVVRMGRRVASLAIQALRRWHHLGYSVQVWINLSVSELSQPELAEHLLAGLRRAGLPPSALGVEVTESMLGDAPGVHDSLLQRLRSAGITVLIDDFGTGYSSLGALKDTPIDIAKIDRSFTAGMLDNAPDTAIVQSVINIGSVMGFEVVAEGVETTRQLQALADLECHNVQGWLFTRALPVDAVAAQLPQWMRGYTDHEIRCVEVGRAQPGH
jgi:diguanylate cyclase (GGDEF)-like protein/PAS domain S-box-containing protein